MNVGGGGVNNNNLFDVVDGWTCDPTIPVGELTAGQSIVCTASYTIVAADIEAGSVFNQACTDSDETLEVCDDVARLSLEADGRSESTCAPLVGCGGLDRPELRAASTISSIVVCRPG